MYLPHTRARLPRKDYPTGHERPEIFDRGSRGRNRRERFALILVGVTNGMVAGTATRLEKLFAVQTMPTGVER